MAAAEASTPFVGRSQAADARRVGGAAAAGAGRRRAGAVAVDGVDGLARAWAGPRSARSRLKTSIHCWRASSRDSATRWAVLLSRPRVMATYAAAAPVVSPSATWARSDGVALGAVDGGGVRELDEPGRVLGRDTSRPVARARPCRMRLPSSPMPVTVQVWRFATWRSGSLRRVATRSPSPIRSPAAVVIAAPSSPLGVVVVVADGGVEVGDLFAGVGDDQLPVRRRRRRGLRCARPRRGG